MDIQLIVLVVAILAFIEGFALAVFPKELKSFFKNIRRTKKIGIIEMIIALVVILVCLIFI